MLFQLNLSFLLNLRKKAFYWSWTPTVTNIGLLCCLQGKSPRKDVLAQIYWKNVSCFCIRKVFTVLILSNTHIHTEMSLQQKCLNLIFYITDVCFSKSCLLFTSMKSEVCQQVETFKNGRCLWRLSDSPTSWLLCTSYLCVFDPAGVNHTCGGSSIVWFSLFYLYSIS